MQVSHRIHTKVPQTGDIWKIRADIGKILLKEDHVQDQMRIKEYIDPFTGEPAGKSK